MPQVLGGEANIGASVVIADWCCDWVGLGLAEKLAREGSQVRLCVDGEMAGQNPQKYLRWQWMGNLHQLGVEVVLYARFFGDEDTAHFQHTTSGETLIMEQMDTLVLALGHEPDTGLERELSVIPVDIKLAGDCLSPRPPKKPFTRTHRRRGSLSRHDSVQQAVTRLIFPREQMLRRSPINASRPGAIVKVAENLIPGVS